MNIDFIKWMCDKAEGFEWSDGRIIVGISIYVIGVEPFSILIYPLLLQRAIEGVNKANGDRFISTGRDSISCNRINYDYHHRITFDNSIDKAKESALMYIYKQEKK